MKPRRAIHPAASVATGGIAGLAGQIATVLIVSSNPELAPFAVAIGTGVTGALSGLGNAARSSERGWVRMAIGWIG